MNKIKVGDWVTIKSEFGFFTADEKCKVIETNEFFSKLIDGDGDIMGVNNKHLTLAPKTTPRPHAELRKRWLDNDKMVVEFYSEHDVWLVTDEPLWIPNIKYREKPSEPTERDLIMQEIQEAQDKLNAAKKRLEDME